ATPSCHCGHADQMPRGHQTPTQPMQGELRPRVDFGDMLGWTKERYAHAQGSSSCFTNRASLIHLWACAQHSGECPGRLGVGLISNEPSRIPRSTHSIWLVL